MTRVVAMENIELIECDVRDKTKGKGEGVMHC